MKTTIRTDSPREISLPENNRQRSFDCSGKIDKLKTALFFVLSLPYRALKKTYQFAILSFSGIFHYFEPKESVHEQQVRQAKELPLDIILKNFKNLDEGLQDIVIARTLSHRARLHRARLYCLANTHVGHMFQYLCEINGQSSHTNICLDFPSANMFELSKSHNLNPRLSRVIRNFSLTQNKTIFDDFLENFKDVVVWKEIVNELWDPANTRERKEKITAIFEKQKFNALFVQEFMLIHLHWYSDRFQKDRDGHLIETLIKSMPEEAWDSGTEEDDLSGFIEALENFKKQSVHPELWETFIQAVRDKYSEPLTKFAGKTS